MGVIFELEKDRDISGKRSACSVIRDDLAEKGRGKRGFNGSQYECGRRRGRRSGEGIRLFPRIKIGRGIENGG